MDPDIHEDESVDPGSMQKECGRMRERDYHKIQRQFPFLIKDLKPLPICIELFSRGVFNADDKDEIEAIKGRVKQCDKLLMKVLNECGPNAFPKFLDALTSTGHHHARAILGGDIQEEDCGNPSHCVVNVNLSEANFDPDYNNHNNYRFKSLAEQLEKAVITELKRNGSGETWAVVVDMRKGSIIVTFVFTTYPKTNSKNLQPIVEQILESGYIGPYKVSRDHFSFCRIGDWQAIPDQIKEDISCQSKDTREQLYRRKMDPGNLPNHVVILTKHSQLLRTTLADRIEIVARTLHGSFVVTAYQLKNILETAAQQPENGVSVLIDIIKDRRENFDKFIQCLSDLEYEGLVRTLQDQDLK